MKAKEPIRMAWYMLAAGTVVPDKKLFKIPEKYFGRIASVASKTSD